MTSIDPVPSNLVFDANGLAPAIIQDDETGDVLMLAWMDHEAIRRTITTGRVTLAASARVTRVRTRDVLVTVAPGILAQGGHVRAPTVRAKCRGRLRRRHVVDPRHPDRRSLPHRNAHLLYGPRDSSVGWGSRVDGGLVRSR